MDSGKIGFLGGGHMAEGIIKGLLAENVVKANDIIVKEILPERAVYLKDTFHITIADDYKELADATELIVLAVRPQDAEKVGLELSSYIRENSILVSICAGIEMKKLAGWIGEKIRYARIMPNTLIDAKQGYSALAYAEHFGNADREAVEKITNAIGDTLVIKEEQFDAFTALSCAGPAWIILYANALIDAGVEAGLSRADSKHIVTKNLIGTGLILEKNAKHPNEILDDMNTPGGITIAGLHSFAKAGLHGITMDGVLAAWKRSQELGKENA